MKEIKSTLKIAGSVSCSANTVLINRKDDHGILELPCHAEGDSEMEEVQKNNGGGEERGRIPDLITLENFNQTWTSLKFPSFCPEIWKYQNCTISPVV